MSKRLFVAIDIEVEFQEAIGRLQDELKHRAEELKVRAGDIKWTRPEQIHLTLKFLGSVDDERVDDVCRAVRRAMEGREVFQVRIGEAGYFGKRTASVLWVGVSDADGKLGELAEAIENELEAVGFARESREFAGHLTMGRVKHPKAGKKLAKLIEEYGGNEIGTLEVKAVAVYESQLKADGPVYALVENCELTNF